MQLEAFSSCPIAGYLGEETNIHHITTSFQVAVESDKVFPLPPLVQTKQSQFQFHPHHTAAGSLDGLSKRISGNTAIYHSGWNATHWTSASKTYTSAAKLVITKLPLWSMERNRCTSSHPITDMMNHSLLLSADRKGKLEWLVQMVMSRVGWRDFYPSHR